MTGRLLPKLDVVFIWLPLQVYVPMLSSSSSSRLRESAQSPLYCPIVRFIREFRDYYMLEDTPAYLYRYADDKVTTNHIPVKSRPHTNTDRLATIRMPYLPITDRSRTVQTADRTIERLVDMKVRRVQRTFQLIDY